VVIHVVMQCAYTCQH